MTSTGTFEPDPEVLAAIAASDTVVNMSLGLTVELPPDFGAEVGRRRILR